MQLAAIFVCTIYTEALLYHLFRFIAVLFSAKFNLQLVIFTGIK